jgi:citrate lyase gamma subunit
MHNVSTSCGFEKITMNPQQKKRIRFQYRSKLPKRFANCWEEQVANVHKKNTEKNIEEKSLQIDQRDQLGL